MEIQPDSGEATPFNSDAYPNMHNNTMYGIGTNTNGSFELYESCSTPTSSRSEGLQSIIDEEEPLNRHVWTWREAYSRSQLFQINKV